MSMLQLLFALLLVLANGFFVGAEFALVSVRRSQIEPLGTTRARQVLYGLENLANLDQLPEAGATLIALPMKIGGGSGGPTRVIAILP